MDQFFSAKKQIHLLKPPKSRQPSILKTFSIVRSAHCKGRGAVLGSNDASNDLQLVVPTKLRSGVLESLHVGVTGGHLGHEKTLVVSRKGSTGLGIGMIHENGILLVKSVPLASLQLTPEEPL